MKLLIIEDLEVFAELRNTHLQKLYFDEVVYLRDGKLTLGDRKLVFDNVLEMSQRLEELDINGLEVTLIGGVLSFSSEINIRKVFGGLLNISKYKFFYYDRKSLIDAKSASLNRVFHTLAVDPKINNIENRILTMEFDREECWKDYSLEATKTKIKNNHYDSDGVIDIISEAAKNRESLSLIRLNHCENRLIGFDYTFDIKEAEITYDIQFGYKLPERDTSYISFLIKDAVKNADVLGCPVFVGNSTNTLNLLENSTAIHLNDLSLLQGQKFVTVNCHYRFGQSLKFKKLLKSCQKLVAITCRDVSRLENVLDRNIDTIKIPAENRFAGGIVEKEQHYPVVFEKVKNEIFRNVVPGTIVLIGAGILGKIYCGWVKEAGGIGIDVGSLMDAIAQVDSRSGGFQKQSFWWE